MVRKYKKYRWSEREIHFFYISVQQERWKHLEKVILAGSNKPQTQFVIPQFKKISSISVSDETSPDSETRFERESGTTNPDKV